MRNLLKTFFLLALLLFCGLFWTEGWANSSHECSSHPTFSCSPVPPFRFCALIKRCSKKDIVHVLKWTPSPDPHVIGYKVFQGNKLIKKTRKHRVVIHHRLKISYLYKLVAVDSSCRESAPLFLRVVQKKSSKKCKKCPEFAVIQPAISTGEVGVFFSQNFTTDSCVNHPTFSTNSMLPVGLSLFPDGELSGTPTQPGTFPIIVTATDAHGCTAQSHSYNLTITCNVITLTTQIVNPTCNDSSNGSLTILASEGNPPFSYSINGSAFQASNIFNNLAAGTYAIIVKDANGCIGQGSAILINPQTLTFTTTNMNPFCNGQANGSITFQAIGGTPPYLFSINGGSSFQSSNVFTGLSAGTYFLEVMDANGCIGQGSATLVNPQTLTFTTTNVNPLCNGQASGSITFQAIGGTPPYLFSINGGSSFQSSNVFTELSAGTYFLEVMDANLCFVSESMSLMNPSAITFTTTIVNVCSSMSVPPHNGSITINASGGTGAFIYSIDGGTTFQSSNIFSNLSANTYSLVVQDSNGCMSSGMAIVNASNINLFASLGSCNNGHCNITLVVSGGTGPYTFTMAPMGGGTPISNQDGIFMNLTCGITYTNEVIDSNGCSATAGPVFCDL